MASKDATQGAYGFANMTIKIEEITPPPAGHHDADGVETIPTTIIARYAYGSDNFGRNITVPLSTQRAKGVEPKVGETWAITKELGLWTFAAILDNSQTVIVESVVAGRGIGVDDTDPTNPVVNIGGDGGGVLSVVAGTGIGVNDTDPTNPVVNNEGVLSVVAGTGIGVVDTSGNPVVNNEGVLSVVAGTDITVDNTDPSNPIVNGSGGAGATWRVHATNDMPWAPGWSYFTVTDPIDATSGPGIFTGSIGGSTGGWGFEGFGQINLDEYNNIIGGSWTGIFREGYVVPEGGIVELDTITYKGDPVDYTYHYHIGMGGSLAFLAGSVSDWDTNQAWTLGETSTFDQYMPPAGSGPSDWPGAFVSMFMENDIVGAFAVEEGGDGFDEILINNPGLFVQGPLPAGEIIFGASYPAVWRGAVIEGGSGPGFLNRSDYPKANVWVDATTGAPGLWVTDATGTPYFIAGGGGGGGGGGGPFIPMSYYGVVSGVPTTDAHGSIQSANTHNSIGIGPGTLASITSSLATYNIAIGNNAMQNSTTATGNVAIGRNSMQYSAGANGCVAIGGGALISGAGYYHVAIGNGALGSVTGGHDTVAIGLFAGAWDVSSGANTHVGARAGYYTYYGNGNTAVGWGAGAAAGYDPSNLTALGFQAQVRQNGGMALGVDSTGTPAVSTEVDQAVIGTDLTTVFIPGAFMPPQHASAPPYVRGLVYFNTALCKLQVGGVSGWETITSV